MLAAVMLLLVPRWFGHSFNNAKDIPFAVGCIWTLEQIVRSVSSDRKLDWRRRALLGICIGVTTAIRVVGAYLAVVWICASGYALAVGPGEDRSVRIKALLRDVPKVCAFAYLSALPFWPLLLDAPLSGPLEAVTMFFSFGKVHTSFFEGETIQSQDVPRRYAPKWFLLTLPEHIQPCLRWRNTESGRTI